MVSSRDPIVLNVAEKPSVARALAQVFGRSNGAQDRGMTRANGNIQIFRAERVRFPHIFEQGDGGSGGGSSTSARDVTHTMVTSSVRGHLVNRDFPQPNYGWSSCSPSALFDAPLETNVSEDMQPLLKMLQTEARKADALILWLDCDREGEAIAAEVRQVCVEANPRLNQSFHGRRDCPTKVFRAKFSTVLPQEIHRALRTLGRVNEAFVDAVEARSEIDLRVGAAFTRFQTLRLQKKFDGLQETSRVISYGPCQFPTLGFVVERWARIETFVPDQFWYLDMKLTLSDQEDDSQENIPPTINDNHQGSSRRNQQPRGGGGRTINFTWKRTRLYDRLITLVLYESCLDAGEAVVTSLTGRPKNRWRPIPLATVELQKRASKFLHIGSETLMTAAEELYQQGYISYPRTETERFRPEFDHLSLIQSFQPIRGDWGQYATKLLTNNNFQNPRAGPHDDQAHPPITPCKAVHPDDISDSTQRGVYTLVVKHYLACVSRDALGKETEIVAKIASEEFVAKGLMITERNWLEIYAPWERWSTGQGELPNVRVGSRIVPTSLLMKEGVTTAPPPISEVELINLMDKNGIGTDATIATHISTIQSRDYARKDPQQKFHPTKLGIALIEGYNSMGYQLNKPDLRREMEHECNLVAAGQKTKEQILSPLLTKMKQCFDRVSIEAHKLDRAVARHYEGLGSNSASWRVLRNNVSRCGDCQQMMNVKENSSSNGRSKKMLYCDTCRKGYLLPMGDIRAMDNNNGSSSTATCPLCQFQVVRVIREEYSGNGYPLCPKCFNEPPDDAPLADGTTAATAGSLKCSQCVHPTCCHAGGIRGGGIDIYSCPFCISSSSFGSHMSTTAGTTEGGKVTLGKKRTTYCLSCSNYNTTGCTYTLWLRSAAEVNVEPNGPHCNNCRERHGRTTLKIQIKWKPGSVPPHVNPIFFGCVLCESDVLTEAGIRLPQQSTHQSNHQQRRRNSGGSAGSTTGSGRGGRGGRGGGGRSSTTTTGGRGRGRTGRSGGRGRGRSSGRGSTSGGDGGITCYKCGQAGHFANACPN